jgi:NHLM bacteriocin system ABC transporter peptidase/ATP-binding protein
MTKAPAAPVAKDRKLNTPAILQMEATECGAASLRIILGYYKRWVSLEELRVACGVSRDGSKASNVLRAARAYGMVAKGFKKEPAALRSMKLPFIIFWNFNHFLVVEGFVGNKVHLSDPAQGKHWVTLEEFNESFTGVVLTIEPGPDFQPGGEGPSVLRALRSRFVGAKNAIALLLVCGLALVIPGMVVPAFARIFIDEVLIASRESWVMPLLIGMALTALLRAVLTWTQQYYLLRVETKMALATSAKFFWHALRLPVEFYTHRSPGEISGRVRINDLVANILTEDLTNSLLSIVTAIFFGVLMTFYDWRLALIAFVTVALNLAALQYVATKNKELSQRLAMDRGKLGGVAMSGLLMMETIKSSGGEAGFFTNWSGHQAKFLNALQETSRIAMNLSLLPTLLNAISSTLILGLGAMRVMDGAMTMGTLVAFQSLVASFMTPANQLLGLSSKLQQAQGNMDRLDDVLKYPLDPLVNEDSVEAQAAPLEKLQGEIEFINVSFGYSRAEKPLLENFSMKISPGQRIALVGPSGCGKSTVAKLLMGLYQPWEGEILFDGKPREAYTRYAIINSMAMVDQNIILFTGTVRDNITMWDSTVAEPTLMCAAQDACIHEIILQRPGGYDSGIAEGGSNFSGGQKQRIEIARALVNNPRILVLDEATSALDSLTEQQFDDNLRRRGCSSVVVAHRLSTIRDADEIIVLRAGRTVQRGTHDDMICEEGSLYHQLMSIATH